APLLVAGATAAPATTTAPAGTTETAIPAKPASKSVKKHRKHVRHPARHSARHGQVMRHGKVAFAKAKRHHVKGKTLKQPVTQGTRRGKRGAACGDLGTRPAYGAAVGRSTGGAGRKGPAFGACPGRNAAGNDALQTRGPA